MVEVAKEKAPPKTEQSQRRRSNRNPSKRAVEDSVSRMWCVTAVIGIPKATGAVPAARSIVLSPSTLSSSYTKIAGSHCRDRPWLFFVAFPVFWRTAVASATWTIALERDIPFHSRPTASPWNTRTRLICVKSYRPVLSIPYSVACIVDDNYFLDEPPRLRRSRGPCPPNSRVGFSWAKSWLRTIARESQKYPRRQKSRALQSEYQAIDPAALRRTYRFAVEDMACDGDLSSI